MNKVIKVGISARDELAKGADFLADAVIRTLGPFGENFFIDKGNKITNDGVTVAGEIVNMGSETLIDGQPCNEFNKRGARALYEAASKTNDIAGDGTTTATLLAQAIYTVVSKKLGKEGVSSAVRPTELIKQIEKERIEITDKLIALATPITTKEQLIASAIVSTEDKELGTLIGEAQWEVGKDGYLLAEETAEITSTVEKVRGIRIDNGFGTTALVNNPEKQTLEVEDCQILLTSLTMKDQPQWEVFKKRIMDPLAKTGARKIVVVARAWTDETIKFCMANIQAGMNIYPLSAPYINMTQRMKDLAAVTGATFYDSENSDFDDMLLSGLGNIKKVVAKRMEAIITGTDANEVSVAARVEELEKELEGEVSEFAKKQLSERIAQLRNGFAIVKVGSPSDMERKRLYDKCVDAVNAVRAAFQEGTVPGAGLAYKQIAETLDDSYILKRPLMALYEQITSSAPTGFVIEDWVRDPLKVMRVALEQACVAAGSFATAGGVSTDAWPKDLEQILKK